MKNLLVGVFVVIIVLIGCDLNNNTKPIVETKHLMLDSTGIIVPELTNRFNAQVYFDGDKGARYWISNDFQKYILESAKPLSAIPGRIFSKYYVKKYDERNGLIHDTCLISELNIDPEKFVSKEDILWTIIFLTNQKLEGRRHPLLDNHHIANCVAMTTIGYIICDDNIVREVWVALAPESGRWLCGCQELGGKIAGDFLLCIQ